MNLIKLCGFSPDQNWKLVYRASKHGYLGLDFHQKCDSINNTITIIKTTDNYIFGGYTEKAWLKDAGYIRDNNAFIFSLVNKSNQPFKVKCSDPEHAICNKADHGPVFGVSQQGQGHDLCVKGSSNSTEFKSKSYLNLGRSYIQSPGISSEEEPRVNHFVSIEIEVFSKV